MKQGMISGKGSFTGRDASFTGKTKKKKSSVTERGTGGGFQKERDRRIAYRFKNPQKGD